MSLKANDFKALDLYGYLSNTSILHFCDISPSAPFVKSNKLSAPIIKYNSELTNFFLSIYKIKCFV